MTNYAVTDYEGWNGITAGKKYQITSEGTECFWIQVV